MADHNAPRGELVFCHSCENEWMKDEHGLVCPECHSEIVEIIDPNSDPRAEEAFMDIDEGIRGDRPPPYAGRGNIWGSPPPDPDEGDIRHVEYGSPGGGLRFSSTTYVRGGPGGMQQGRMAAGVDAFPQLLSNILGVMQPQAPEHAQQAQQGQRGFPHPMDNQPGFPQAHQRYSHPSGNFHLNQQPLPMQMPFGPMFQPPQSQPRTQSSVRITTSGFGGTRTQQVPAEDIMGIFGSLLQSVGGAHGGFAVHGGNGPVQPPNPFGFLAQILNPANARSGDAVFTNEALDQVISQLMEQHGGSTAPGPATEGAISALPTIQISKEHLGENGLAECSICMDSVEVGGEVTELPCKHWFHGDCVRSWLLQHDTCPQCRRGITPKEGDSSQPRATGQAPRYWQMSEADFRQEAGVSDSQPSTPHAGPSGPPSAPPARNEWEEAAESHRQRRRSRSSSHRSGGSGEQQGSTGAWQSLLGRLRGHGSGSSSADPQRHRHHRHHSHDSHHGK